MINNIPESNKWINITDFFYMHLFVLVQDKNTSLKLHVGVSPLQFVNLHRNRRYFVIKHMVLSIIFLEDKHKIVLHLSIFYEYQQLFQHRICFSIQPPYYSDPWPTVARFTSFFLFMLFNQISEFWGAHVRPLYCACRSLTSPSAGFFITI